MNQSELKSALSEIQTVEDLRVFLLPILELSELTDDQLIWANALWLASNMAEYTTKDLARMIMKGVSPSNNLEAVQRELDSMMEDGPEEYLTAIVYYIAYIIGNVFGEYEKAEEFYQLNDE